MTDERAAPTANPTPPAPPSEGQPTPESPAAAWEAPPKKRVSRWWWTTLVVVVVVFAGALAGFWIRLPYYTIAPGGELSVPGRIEVTGAKTYRPRGDILLLFVRERAHVNVWRYVQARLDSEIDLIKERDITGGATRAEVIAEAVADMAKSQLWAKKVALQEIGYKVPIDRRGVVVLATVGGYPANGVLQKGDVILAVNGKAITNADTLGTAVRKLRPGTHVTLQVRRDGRVRTIRVATTRGDDGRAQMGVFAIQQYRFPLQVRIDTSDIGGPSAGLAMTLALIDDLTPGNLTGGKRVAVTGTIDPNGDVGEIGGISQKAVAVRAAHAQLFIVPKCTDPEPRQHAACEADLANVRRRSGDTRIVAVENIDEALRALHAAGGDPLERVANRG